MCFPRRALTGVLGLAATLATLVPAGSAAAHVGFESSSPADGDVVDEPVDEIVIGFTDAATPVGEQFVVLGPDGVIREPTSVATDDGATFVLAFDPPLAGGTVGVRWNVQAPDAHPIEGSFSFTVTAAIATTAPASTPASTVAPTPTAPAATDATGEGATAAVTTPATTSTSSPAVAAGGGTGPTLEEFLAVDTSTPGEGRRLVGRVVALLGAIGALGGIAFLVTTLRGSSREIALGSVVVRVFGAVTALGAAIQYWGYVAGSGRSLAGAWTSSPGLGMALRFGGGLAVAAGTLAVTLAVTAGTLRTTGVARPLSAAVIDSTAPTVRPASRRRWDPGRAPVALAGAVAIVVSFWFDGHTVSEGPRAVHALVNSVHVVAGAVWAGGVLAFALTLWSRHRSGRPSHASEMIVRFSSIATVSLIAVALAGALMALFVLDSPGDLTSTEWGQTLLLKTAAVALAAAIGAYNHFRLRPALTASPRDPQLADQLRSLLTAEAILLGFVVAVTAWLVAAAT